MKLYKFTLVFTPDKETKGAWNVSLPALPEVATLSNRGRKGGEIYEDT